MLGSTPFAYPEEFVLSPTETPVTGKPSLESIAGAAPPALPVAKPGLGISSTPVQNIALLRMGGRLVNVSGRSGQAHFTEQISGAWSAALGSVPGHLAAEPKLAQRFAAQLAAAAAKRNSATLVFALIEQGGQDSLVGEFFQNVEIDQLAMLGGDNQDLFRLLGKLSAANSGEAAADEPGPANLVEFGVASVAVPVGDPAAGSLVVTQTHVFPGAWEGPECPGVLRDMVRIHEALTRNSPRKPLARVGQPEIQWWLASQPEATQVDREPAAKFAEPVSTPVATKPALAAPAAQKPQAVPAPAEPVAKPAAALTPRTEDDYLNLAPPPEPNRTMLYVGAGLLVAALATGAYFAFSGAPTAVPSVYAPNPSRTSEPPSQIAAPPPVAPGTQPNTPMPPPSTIPVRTPTPNQPSRVNQAGNQPRNPGGNTGNAPSGNAAAGPAGANAAPVPAPVPAAAPANPPAPAPDANARRAAALDALNGNDADAKRRDAMRALTGQ